jgi:hypothetical protein
MNSRISIATIASFAAALAALASEPGTSPSLPGLRIDAVKSPIIDGYCVGFAGRDGTNNTTTDDWLDLLPWTTNKYPVWIVVPADPEYAYKIELLDANGLSVPKTSRGKKAGSKFDDFDAYPSKHGVAVKRLTAHKMDGVTAEPLLFRATDMFEADKPGRYVLRIQFQILVFPRVGEQQGAYTNELIRFPPLDYPLYKAPNVLTNAPAKGPK